MLRFFGGAAVANAVLIGFIIGTGLGGFLAMGGFNPIPTFSLPVFVARPVVVTAPGAPSVGRPATQARQQPAVAPTEVTVTATDLKFAPTTLEARVGQPVKLTLENKGVIEHDIAFPTLKSTGSSGELKVVAKPGSRAALELTPAAAGTYEYICTVPGHKEAGMRGTLKVAN